MPIIRVSLVAGRTPEAKRALIAELTEATVRAIAAPRETVRVILDEVAPEHWGIGGEPKAPTDPTDRRTP